MTHRPRRPAARRELLGWTAATAAAAFTAPFGPARAQAWPARPIRMLSPYGAGGSNDILARVLGEFLSRRLGQGVVVENKPGAGTRLANELVAHAAPDGYTLLHAAAPIAIGEALYPKLPYDLRTSFAPIVATAIAPVFLVVNADSPYRSVDDLVTAGRRKPEGLTFGSPGAASGPHLAAELFFREAKVKGLNVHLRGDAAAYTELLGGRVDATLTAIATAVPHLQAGKLRVLAVALEERSPLLPQVPTFRELGLPEVVGYGWFGLMAPAGTPAAVIQRLNAETNAAMTDTGVRDKAAQLGLQLRGGTPAEFASFIDREARKWSAIVKAAGITAE